jgi:hypothetical protein
MQFFHENSQIFDEFVTFFVELKRKFSLQPFLKEAEVGRLDEVNLNDSKGPTEATEATEGALHEAQLEDALPTEVKLAGGKQKNTRRQKKETRGPWR